MTDTSRLPANEIIVVLLKDYERSDAAGRAELRDFIGTVTFVFCATALQVKDGELADGLRTRMKALDNLEH